MSIRTLAWGSAALLLAAAATLAQAPTPRSAQAPQAGSQPPAPAYSYSPEGRRDPFVSLLRRGTDPTRSQGKPAEGVGALLVNEISLKGIMHTRGQYVALVQGPDTRTHIVRANDRLLDGIVRAITADAMILMQDVNDPLLPTRQREVRKTLRAAAEQK